MTTTAGLFGRPYMTMVGVVYTGGAVGVGGSARAVSAERETTGSTAAVASVKRMDRGMFPAIAKR